MGYILLGAALVCNALANFLLKLGSGHLAAIRAEGLVRGVLSNYALMSGLVLFAINILFYTFALSRVPLSIGYPLMAAGSLVVVTALSALYLKEAIGLVQMVGIGCIIIGIVLVVQK